MSLKGKPVELSTFLGWGEEITASFRAKEDFNVLLNRSYVTHIVCEVCAKNVDAIKTHPSCKGKANRDMLSYVVGTTYISKYNLKRHLQGKAHRIAMANDTTPSASDAASSIGSSAHMQPKINLSLPKASNEAYRKLFNTAYNIVVHGKPFLDFEYIVSLQKQNGVRLIQGKQSHLDCAEMTVILAKVIKEEIAQVLATKAAFSILTDGSQPKKTGSEMELVYIRVVREGLPHYYCVGLQELSQHGGGDAASIKKAIDNVFEDRLKISADNYKFKCVSITADGAAVNTGQYTGVFRRMTETRSWLLNFHCIAHRAELGAKDAFNSSKDFKDVEEFYESIFRLLKNSGKLKSELKASCEALNVTHYTLPKINGTRFLHHKKRGFEKLIHMWVPLKVTFENAHSSKGYTNDTRCKIQGYIKKLENFEFLTVVCTMRGILDSLSSLSMMFEKQHILAFEVMPALRKTEEMLKEYRDTTPNDLIELVEPYFESVVENEDGVSFKVAKTYFVSGHERRKQNRDSISVEMNVKNVSNKAIEKSLKVKSDIIPKLLMAYVKRFESFKQSIFESFNFLDPENWDMFEETFVREYGVKDLTIVEKHFEQTLCYSDYNSKAMYKEWRQLKLLMKTTKSVRKCMALWHYVHKHKKSEFPNLCILTEIVLSLPASNCEVERGFSFLTHTLNDRRLSLKYEHLEAYMLIRNNSMVWAEDEKQCIIDKAVQFYLRKRRYRQRETDCSSSSSKKQKTGTISLSDSSDSESMMSDTASVTSFSGDCQSPVSYAGSSLSPHERSDSDN